MNLTLLFALTTITTAPLAVQQQQPPAWYRPGYDGPSPGVIVRAALADTSERLVTFRNVADTTWATVIKSRDYDVAPTLPAKEVRLERRGSGWTRVASRPIVLQPPIPESLMALPATYPEGRWMSDSGLTDTAALKQLAVGRGIDTAKATLRFAGDSGWIMSKRPNGSTTVRAVRDGSRWRVHSTEDTTVVGFPPPEPLPVPKRPQ